MNYITEINKTTASKDQQTQNPTSKLQVRSFHLVYTIETVSRS